MAEAPEAYQSFTRWLKRRRQELDLTQDQLAERVGYASPTLQKIERGERRPSREMAERLADILQIGPDERAVFVRLARTPVAPGTDERLVPVPQSAVPAPVHLPLLLTRICPPQPHTTLVQRPRLTGLLGGAQAGMVTLVVGPAGWGKTTLVSSWLIETPPGMRRRVAWLALDAGDREPVELLRYLIAALQRVEPALGLNALAVLESSPPPIDAALRLLVNDLMMLQAPLTLVLDDYHLLRDPALHRIVRFLVEQLPPSLHLIIISREEPPLPLNRLRAQRRLHEIRSADLRFQHGEASALLNETMGLNLNPPTVAALEQWTEGWAVGLQLAALALRDQRDPSLFVSQFVGSHRLVLDYLTEEVLDRLPGHLLNFLLKTSILERLCGALCDAVLGLADPTDSPGDSYSRLIFTELEQANLFLIRLDETRTWYRYHHLFGEVLRARLQRGANPATVRELHRRAAHWYAVQGLWQEALPHAQAAEQWDLAARAVEQIGEELILQGSMSRLKRIIESIPEAARVAHPRLLLLQGIGAIKNFDWATAAEMLTRMLATEPLDPMVRAEALVQLSDCQRSQGDFATARETLRAALAGPLSPRVRNHALISRCFESLVEGDWQGTRAAMDSTLDMVAAQNDRLLRFELAINAHSILLVLPGSVAWTDRFCRLAENWEIPEISPLRAALDWIAGYTRLLRGDLAGSVQQIGRSLDVSGQIGGLYKLVLDAGLQHVVALALYGNPAAAEARIAALLEAMRETASFSRLFAAWYHYVPAWLAIQQGRIEQAAAIAAEMEAVQNPYEWPSSACARLTLRGLLAIEAGDFATAAALFRNAAAEQERYVDAMLIGDARMPLAYCLLREGQQQAALDTLQAAFDTQIQRKTPGVLLISGAPIITPLLRLACERKIHTATATRLLHALPESTPLAEPPADTTLTAREQDVLRLMAQGAGNQAIADALAISLPTVKTHVASILAKLGVSNRTEAVAAAHERGLLPKRP